MGVLIVLDPGHGGKDPGAVANGYQEKALVLQTCLRIREGLVRCGFRVQMTRETDVFPLANGTIAQDLTYRAQLANRARADLYVSWHADAAAGPDAGGVTVFVHPNSGTETHDWAYQILNGMLARTAQGNRGVREADFAVLRETAMPAVLVESGFITNPNEARLLADPAFQVKLAEGFVQGVCGVFNVKYVSPTAQVSHGLDQAAVEKVIAMLGGWWQTASTEDRAALHFAADALRDRVGIPKPHDPAGQVTYDSATRVIAQLGEAWKAAQDVHVQDGLHVAANALRNEVGIGTQ